MHHLVFSCHQHERQGRKVAPPISRPTLPMNDCSNVQPTPEETRSLDLPHNSHVPPTQPATSNVNHEEVQPEEVPEFEDISSKLLEQLLRRTTRVSSIGSTLPPKIRKVTYPPKTNVPKTTQPDEQSNQPFQTLNSPPSQAGNVYDVLHNTDIGGISMPYVVDDSVEKGNVDPQPTSNQFFQQLIPPIQMDFANDDQDIDASTVEVEKQRHVTEENVAKEHVMKDSTEVLPTAHHSHVPIEDIVHNKEVDSTTLASISSGTEAIIDALVYGLPNQLIHAKPLSVIIPLQLTGIASTSLASISSGTEAIIDALVYGLPNQLIHAKPLSVIIPLQLTGSDDFLLTDSTHPTSNPHNRMPSKIMQSPYLTAFGSSDKGKEKINDDICPYTPFEGRGITYKLSSVLMQEYFQWIQKGLFKSHANEVTSALFRFDHMDFVVAFSVDKNWFYTMSQSNKCWTDQVQYTLQLCI
ncbi:hypothetical protein R3W88_024130 [Solanum pinnatisectum]|uniref:Uncharacterized protein n=1 Tax=Solanum pinnatisectum TaxID=50273 RepID=A0AAV9M390_9SOLN|nr:hypothetical protein R3W88_024130 [Solanum pinnatisectum]